MAFARLMAELGLNIAPFQSGLNKSAASADSAGRKIASSLKTYTAAFFSVAALKSVFDKMSVIKDMADQLAITTDQVQELGAAADSVGLSFDDMAAALNRIAIARSAAISGNEEIRASFKRLGISLNDVLNTRGINSAAIAAKIGASLGPELDAQKIGAMVDVVGKAGPRISAALRDLENFKGIPKITDAELAQLEKTESWFKKIGKAITTDVGRSMAWLSASFSAWKEPMDDFASRLDKVKAIGPAIALAYRAASIPAAALGTVNDAIFGISRIKPSTKPPESRERVRDIAKDDREEKARRNAEFDLEEESARIAFDAMKPEQQKADLRRQLLETEQDLLRLSEGREEISISETERQTMIANKMKERLQLEERIKSIHNQDKGAFDIFTRIGGAPGAFRGSAPAAPSASAQSVARTGEAAMKQVELLTQVLNQLQILNGGKKIVF